MARARRRAGEMLRSGCGWCGNPLQAPRPEPIPVVTDWIEYLAMGVLELSAGKFAGKVGCDATLHALFTIRWQQGLDLDVFRTLGLAGACESGQNLLQNNGSY